MIIFNRSLLLVKSDLIFIIDRQYDYGTMTMVVCIAPILRMGHHEKHDIEIGI